jgi:hypothetical protein
MIYDRFEEKFFRSVNRVCRSIGHAMKEAKMIVKPAMVALLAAILSLLCAAAGARAGWAQDGAQPSSSPSATGDEQPAAAPAPGNEQPAPAEQQVEEDYRSIIDSGRFGEVSGPSGSPPPSASPSAYRLVGTIKGKEFSGAVLIDAAGVQAFYLLNELLPDGSRIVKVQSDRISVKSPDGVVTELVAAEDVKGAPTAAPPQTTAPSMAPPSPEPAQSETYQQRRDMRKKEMEKRRRKLRRSSEEE